MSPFSFNNKTIIIISQQDWGTVKLSKHLYAEELSKNNKVFYLYSVPVDQQQFATTQRITDKLSVIRINRRIKGIHSLPIQVINFQSKRLVKRILKYIDEPSPDVVWSFEQSRFQNLKHFNAKLCIFHPADYIRQATSFVSRIANSADLVLSISQAILDQIETATPKHFIHHGLDDVFIRNIKINPAPDFLDSDKVNIGYIGNLRIKLIDWDMMIEVVSKNPNLNFVFIGPDEVSNIGGKIAQPKLNDLKKLPNTKFTGSYPKEELAKVMPHFDLFWLCYDNKKFPIEVSNSHKIMEYLSTGKTVVSNPISTYGKNKLLEMVETNQLAEKIGSVALNLSSYNSKDKINSRKAFAQKHTYDNNIRAIESIINKLR